jgi:hypothetical protein
MFISIFCFFQHTGYLCSSKAVLATYLNTYVVPHLEQFASARREVPSVNSQRLPVDVTNASLIIDLTSNSAYPFLQVYAFFHLSFALLYLDLNFMGEIEEESQKFVGECCRMELIYKGVHSQSAVDEYQSQRGQCLHHHYWVCTVNFGVPH